MAEKEKQSGGKKETIARYYEIANNKVQRRNQWCPKCGPGVFLAAHRDRVSCGRCGYTEFKKEAAPQK